MLSAKINVVSNVNGTTHQQTFGCSEAHKVFLTLNHSHYKYIDISVTDQELIDLLDNKVCILENKNEWRKPTLVISYRSDVAFRKIAATKKNLQCCNEFNIICKTKSRIIDLMRVADRITLNRETKEIGKPNDSETMGVVYQAKCLKCPPNTNTYIGETGRKLSTRIKEHCRKINFDDAKELKTSAIAQHSALIHGEQPHVENWDFTILHKERKNISRKTLEALEIRKAKPTLNRDKGITILGSYPNVQPLQHPTKPRTTA
jgi:hypothetical protein